VKYTIILKRKAEKELLRLQRDDVIKIREAINSLAENPARTCVKNFLVA